MTARRYGSLVAALALTAAAPAPPPPPNVDLLIRGGTVYTGEGKPFYGDVAITGDRIVQVGKSLKVTAKRTIIAKGMIVAPGFIDPHTHMGGDLASDDAAKRLIPAFLMQGVTTAFIGNDGGGNPDIAAVLASAKTKPVGINYAAYVGFGAVREKVIGAADRAPTDAELTEMKRLVATAMCQGALGLSTGLFYAPQSFAKTGEVIDLAKEAASRGGVYDSHIRDESSYTVGLAGAIDEVLEIGRGAKLPVHIAHIKALGVDVHGMAPAIIAKIEAARAAGLNVTADQYPWEASGTSLVASLMPLWALDGGRPALLKRFDDPTLTKRLRDDIAENMRKRGGADKLLIVGGQYRNKTLAAVATERGEDAVTAAIAAIKLGDAGVVSFNQSEGDIAAFMKRPWVVTSSDASGGHPRIYGSFARKFGHYVQKAHVISIADFIASSTWRTADMFGIKDRGRLKKGAFADVAVFSPAQYSARATYAEPTLLAQGMRYVVVNGQVAVDKGEMTGTAAGRALAHAPTGSCQ